MGGGFPQKMLTFATTLLAISKLGFAYKNELILCEGIWGGNFLPFTVHPAALKVEIVPVSLTGSLTVAVYEFQDKNFFIEGPEAYQICYLEQVSSKKCNSSDINKFIINNSSKFPSTPALNQGVYWHGNQFKGHDENVTSSLGAQETSTNGTLGGNSPLSFAYNVSRTGYYCALAVPDPSLPFQDYSVKMYIQNPFGAIPSIFYPAMPFFAAQLVAYLLIGLFWGFASFVNRRELLRMQNLIGSMILFLIVENCVSLSFFIDFNNHGFISKSFLGTMVSLNAGRNSLSFFILLVVCLGYGVVYPSLGSKMYWVIGLTVVHFIFGALYFTYSMIQRNPNSFLIFLLGLPLAFTLFVFYVCILLGISSTVMHLESKRQSIKLLMYKRLYRILTISILFLSLICIANALNMLFRNSSVWIANQWKWSWLLLDGALNMNYFVTFCAIAYLWMPTRNNGRLALEQIGTEDIDEIPGHDFDDFELDTKEFSDSPFKDFSTSFLGIDEEEIEDLQPSLHR